MNLKPLAPATLMAISVLLFLAPHAHPQQNDEMEGTIPTIRVDVELVVLHATVEDGKGRRVDELAQGDFVVYDNDVPQEVRVFSNEDVPVTMGLVIDNSGSMRHKKDEVVSAALAFAQSSNPQDELFVVHFNEFVGYGLPPEKQFTSSVTELEDALVDFAPEGRTALYDALEKALRHLERGAFDKKVLLVISDGGDNASSIEFKDVLALADQSNVIIYTIGLFDETADDKNPAVVRRLAKATGGQSFIPKSILEVYDICIRIATDIRNQYTLGYKPDGPGTGEGYHSIRVTATHPRHGKLKVRTREGYTAKGEASP